MVHRGWLRPQRPPFGVPRTAYQLALGRGAVVYTWRVGRRWMAHIKASKYGRLVGVLEGLRTRDRVAKVATAFWKEWA